MLGSLVIVFPTPHEGGALLVRHRGQEWSFDPGWEFTASRTPTIGRVAQRCRARGHAGHIRSSRHFDIQPLSCR
jgi:hypothetical protein